MRSAALSPRPGALLPALVSVLLAAFAAPLALAQEVSGRVFEDADADGVLDADEVGLEGFGVRLFGQADAGGTLDETQSTDASGLFRFTPGEGCYLVGVNDPPGWRRTLARFEGVVEGASGYTAPVGLRRYGGAPALIERLAEGQVLFSSMGDSIATNYTFCGNLFGNFRYSREIRDRLRCVAPSASVDLDQAAIKGEHSDDLLIEDLSESNNVFAAINSGAELVTISIIGNDLLNDEPDPGAPPEETNRATAELLDSRANLQEILSALVSELPDAAIELNTLYDNLASACDTSEYHREWLPIVNRILRDVAWGQARRVTNAEVFVEFSQLDLASMCTGFTGKICTGTFDGIHPNEQGYDVIREALWESIGGASIGPRDALGASSITTADHGYLRRVARLFPSNFEARSGALVENGEAAFDDADGGASASVRLGIDAEEVRYGGFPSWRDELVPVRVVAGIRYTTSGDVTDDFYRVEASVDGVFRPPPGHVYTTTDWNYYTPIVGGGGPNAPAEDPDYPDARLLVLPDVAAPRTVSATLTQDPIIDPAGDHYLWPALTLAEIGTTELRIAAAPVAGTAGDDFALEVDALWLDVYGLEKERPPEVGGLALRLEETGAVVLAFDELAGAQRYNLYAGSLAPLAERGAFDHGDPSTGLQRCDAEVSPAGPGRLETRLSPSEVPEGQAYFLVTAHVDDVESPSGFTSAGVERPREESACR